MDIKEIKINNYLDWDEMTGHVEVVLKMDQVQSGYLAAHLKDQKGKEADAIFPIEIEETMEFCMLVKEPQLWNAELPYMYDLVLEFLDKNHQMMESVSQKIPFYKWTITDGRTCLNGMPVRFKTEVLKEPGLFRKKIQKTLDVDQDILAMTEKKRSWLYLIDLKKAGKNALLLDGGEVTEELEYWCHLCGIYLIVRGVSPDAVRLLTEYQVGTGIQGENQSNENDFQMQVTRSGVMIENHSTFINANVYELYYEIAGQGTTEKNGTVMVDIPAGKSKYIDLPFGNPKKAGQYTYLAALRLKEQTAWERKGYMIAQDSVTVLNLYQC